MTEDNFDERLAWEKVPLEKLLDEINVRLEKMKQRSNKRVHSIATPPGDPVDAQARSE
jgi:hypothetical protein